MCGITGKITSSNTDPQVLERELNTSLDLIIHRGPDNFGTYFNAGVALGMRRLSIIDVTGGNQPFYNREKTVCAFLNGEIYNYREIRADLQKKGYLFATDSDTEVIPHLYDEYGLSFINSLNGMFAIALYDRKRQTLVLVRDRFGIKPLYYYYGENTFCYSSEIKGIRPYLGVKSAIDIGSVWQYLRYGYSLNESTMMKGIKRLPPGNLLVYKTACCPEIKPYWVPEAYAKAEKGSNTDPLALLDRQLAKAVKYQLISDVPLGVLLSGGLDSSMITAYVRQILGPRGNIQTFTVGVNEPGYIDERPYARMVSRRLNTEHFEYILTRKGFIDSIPLILDHLDDPTSDYALAPLFHIVKEAKRHVTVLLSGEGSDEIFGGYKYYSYTMLLERLKALFPFFKHPGKFITQLSGKSKAIRYIEKLGMPLETSFTGQSEPFSHVELMRLLKTPAEYLHFKWGQILNDPDISLINRLLLVDIGNYLPNDLLNKADRMSMAHSLELRVPFLDHNLFESVFAMPEDLKISGFKRKILLKKLAEKYLPHEVIYRRKRGFEMPVKLWFTSGLSTYLQHELLEKPCELFKEYFNMGEVADILNGYLLGKNDETQKIWALLLLNHWIRRNSS